MKKFLGFSVVAVAFALSVSFASAANYSIMPSLTMGSTGPEVVKLQEMLIAKGNLVLPAGVNKGYFGTLTKNALAAFQVANGISPAVGYYGSATAAKVNAMAMGGTTGGNTSGNTSGSLAGGDGDFKSFKLLGTPSSEDLYEGDSANVVGFEFIAKDSDLELDRIELVASSTSGSVKKPWKVLDKVVIKNGSKEVADMDASDSDSWDEVGSTNTYTIKLSGLNSIVKEAEKAKIYVEVTVKDSVDTSDTGAWDIGLTLDGIRATNAEGVDVYEGSASDKKNFTVKEAKAGDVSVTVDTNDNKDQAVSVDDDNDTNDVLAYTAVVKSKTGTNNVESVDITLASPSSETLTDMIGTVYLFIDGDEVGSESAAATVTFDDLDFDLKENKKIDFEVRTDLNDTNDGARYQNGDTFNVTGLTVDYVDSMDDDGSAVTTTDGGVLTLSTTTLNVSPSTLSAKTLSNDAKAEFKIAYKVTAPSDEDVYIPVSVNATYFDVKNAATNATTTLNAASSTKTLARTSGGSDEGSYYKITAGNTATFTLTAVVDNTGQGAKSIKTAITGVEYKVGSTGATTQVYTAGVDEDYQTDSTYVENVDLL